MSLDAVGIVSENLPRSLAFYKLLGLEFNRFGDGDHYEAQTPSGVRIMLDSLALVLQFSPDFKKPNGSGVVMAFKQKDAAEVNKLHDEITSAGFKSVKAPWDAFWGQRYACVSDPDGNQVDLFATL
jgi:uncharacterized glyoxalase superfamily protein PhnB